MIPRPSIDSNCDDKAASDACIISLWRESDGQVTWDFGSELRLHITYNNISVVVQVSTLQRRINLE